MSKLIGKITVNGNLNIPVNISIYSDDSYRLETDDSFGRTWFKFVDEDSLRIEWINQHNESEVAIIHASDSLFKRRFIASLRTFSMDRDFENIVLESKDETNR